MVYFTDLINIILDLKYSKYINKKSSICISKDCYLKASFNYLNNKKRLYCNNHKLDNMININDIKRSCIEPKCLIRASYNYKNKDKPIYCNKHKLDNMINIINKYCCYLNCKILATYNYKNENKPLYCNKHKLDNMISITNKNKLCIIHNCLIRANYNYKTEKNGLYCKNHKLENMIDVVNKNLYCKLCNLIRATKKYDYLCSSCFYYTNPTHILTRNHKTKENQIINDLNIELNNIIIQDKIIYGGCSKRRPDGLIKLNDYNIIIEIDEEQHQNYECENKRLMEIFKDLGNSPLTIIRFNPDSYKENLKTIKSPFGITKLDGKLKIINQKEYNKRFIKLLEIIQYNIHNIPKKEINIIHLFYNI